MTLLKKNLEIIQNYFPNSMFAELYREKQSRYFCNHWSHTLFVII